MAAKANLTIEQGTDVSVAIDVTSSDLDLTLYTCRSQMKKHYASNNSVTLTCSISDSNTVILSLDHVQSANITPGRYVYDVEIILANNVTRLVEGMITVLPEVTTI